MSEFTLPEKAIARFARAVILRELNRLHAQGLATDRRAADPDWQDRDLELDSLQTLGVIGALREALTLEHPGPGFDDAKSLRDWVASAVARPTATLTIATSGSTGQPQWHAHPARHLLDEARWFAARLPAVARVISLVPADHLYGLIWTAILPAILDVPVVEAKAGFLPAPEKNDLVVAVPEQWAALARIPRRWSAGTVGVSSGGPLDDHAASAALERGLPRLLDIYGASECGAIAMREMPGNTHALLPCWSIEDARHGQMLVGRGKRMQLPDRVETAPDGSIVLVGRRDHAVSIGGVNVYPGRVAERLRGIEGVAEVAVRMETRGRLKACIVPMGGTDEDALRKRIENFAKRALQAPERPCDVAFASALPRNELGKLCDW